ncbi:MAG TPA: tRNA (adenosine(37)-N6)-dimethylallyltransferase MiaA [Chryseolinea sp.]
MTIKEHVHFEQNGHEKVFSRRQQDAARKHYAHSFLTILPGLKKGDKTLLVVAGPTAVGKTGVAIKIAQAFRTDVVSADSRQIFKELTIGTAKPSEEELAQVRHHFVNTHSIKDDYDAAQYGRDALALISRLFEQHDVLILCGGSGLYIQAVCDGFDDIPEVSPGLREQLVHQYEQHGVQWLQERMQQLDNDHFQQIDQKNPHRLIRALEVRLSTGKSISAFRTRNKITHAFSIVKIGLELPREELYRRIDDRMDSMIRQGLFDEAKKLYQYKNRRALQTVGYQEIFDFMDGKYELDEAIRLLKRNSRRYAKRQLTWFKRDAEMNWFSGRDIEKIMEFVRLLKSGDTTNPTTVEQ